MDKGTVVLYHAFCDDGMGAALAAYLKFGDNAEYIGVQYGDIIPDVVGKDVYIFDFSFPEEQLLDPKVGAKSITMLDHHLSAFKAWNTPLYVDAARNILVRFDMKRSGAMLAWDYIFPDTIAPMIIQHVQDYDLWKFDMPNTKYFIGNLRSWPQDVKRWKEMMEYTNTTEGYETFVREGIAQDRFFKSQMMYILRKSQPLPITIDGVKGIGINASSTFASDMGSEMALQSGTFGMVFYLEGDMVTCSVRSTNGGTCDVSELCKAYGGGGHRNAAGMKLTIDMFLKEILCNQHWPTSLVNLPR
jgi:oligoribonuclease NrnB/cAMP/cGMP phosphodiesterase (DHH superfamily)